MCVFARCEVLRRRSQFFVLLHFANSFVASRITRKCCRIPSFLVVGPFCVDQEVAMYVERRPSIESKVAKSVLCDMTLGFRFDFVTSIPIRLTVFVVRHCSTHEVAFPR